MKRLYTFLLMLISTSAFCQTGGVAVNTAGAPPDSSAVFDISSINKGFLIPRMTTAQRDAILNPAEALQIYNTDCKVYNYNAGTPANPNWVTINSSNTLIAGVGISANPVGAICAGASVTFTATPAGGINSPSYQWQVNGANVGTNSTAYTSTSLNNGDVVTCILSSAAPCVTGSPATSNAVTMAINSVPAITGTAPASFCSGSAVTLGASASLGTINWYPDSTGGSSLTTGASFTVSGLTSTTTYYVDATANGCTTPSRTAVTATSYPSSPGQPGTIAGPSGISTDSVAYYSINALPNTVSYSWTVSLLSIVSGQGTTSIGVKWGDTSGLGSVSVVANNPCGTSVPQTASVYVGDVFSYTGGAQTFTVPAGITSVTITAYGAAGGGGNSSGAGGLGGSATGTLTVTPGEQLQFNVGGAPVNNTGGWNGGGTGGTNGSSWAGGGGGASDVRTPADYSLNGRILVGGGGGGWGNDGDQGGDGGDSIGAVTGNSYTIANGAGGGGTQTAGGSAGADYIGPWPQLATNGNAGSFGTGGDGVYNTNSGGYLTGAGGGGWYGGGSGATSGQWAGGSGGGGSGYIGGVTNGSMKTGVQSGNGQIVVVW